MKFNKFLFGLVIPCLVIFGCSKTQQNQQAISANGTNMPFDALASQSGFVPANTTLGIVQASPQLLDQISRYLNTSKKVSVDLIPNSVCDGCITIGTFNPVTYDGYTFTQSCDGNYTYTFLYTIITTGTLVASSANVGLTLLTPATSAGYTSTPVSFNLVSSAAGSNTYNLSYSYTITSDQYCNFQGFLTTFVVKTSSSGTITPSKTLATNLNYTLIILNAAGASTSSQHILQVSNPGVLPCICHMSPSFIVYYRLKGTFDWSTAVPSSSLNILTTPFKISLPSAGTYDYVVSQLLVAGSTATSTTAASSPVYSPSEPPMLVTGAGGPTVYSDITIN